METTPHCPGCQKPLPPDVPLGLCPECLIKSGFNTGTEPGAQGDKSFVPLSVAEVAKLFPQFEILGLLGQGGMGAVYKARQPGLDRLIALKLLPPHASDDPGFVERFNREAKALARLNHPNIVAVHDFGKAAQVEPVKDKPEDGQAPAAALCYLVMEFVDGMNLREVERAGRLTPDQALKIVPQICDALQFAHNEGVVHRDIKPENILLDKKGRVKITDFGIAKIIGTAPEKIGLTGAKDIIGTPHYMAPEQVERPNAVDHRADIYSLGVVFYELLTGELPIGKFAPPSRKVQVDVRLDDVVLRALEKEPERRYQQASEVKTDVGMIAATPPVYPPSAPRFSPAPQPGNSAAPLVKAHLSRAAIIGAVWAVFSVFAFVAWFGVRRVEAQPGVAHQILLWGIVLQSILLLLGVSAPFGTTILGWVAVSQIRRSNGRLYGMALAVVDGLIFPLLLVVVAIFLFVIPMAPRPSMRPAAMQSEPASSPNLERPGAQSGPIPSQPESVQLSENEMRNVMINLKSAAPMPEIAADRLTHATPGVHRDEVVSQLLVLLKDPNWPTRRAAAAALGVWGTDKDFDSLAAALDDSNMSVRWAAIYALGRLKNPKSADVLARHLAEANSEDVLTTSSALQSLDSSAEDAVIPLLQSKKPQVRNEACRILGKIGTNKSLPALTAVAADSDRVASMLARNAMEAIEKEK
jgi:hypothetical protein